MKNRFHYVLAILVTLIFSACSNSGGGSPEPVTYSISGTITAPANAAMDSDVNDPVADFAENDTVASAQSIPNPVTLGGFVNLPNHGETGRSQIAGDQVDYYQVSLTSGQTVTMNFAEDPITTDIDLYLYNSGGTQVASSIGVTSTESIIAPSSSTFYIAVKMCGTSTNSYDCYSTLPSGYSGASNYVLSIGSGANSAIAADFVPGDIIVTFKEQQLSINTNGKAKPSLTSRATSLGMIGKAGGPGRAMLMSLGNEQQTKQAFTALGIKTTPTMQHGMRFKDKTARRKFETRWAIKALQRRTDVASADLNYIRKAQMIPNDSYYSYQWHYPLINLPQAWDITTGSSNVVVAVVDTGVFMAHPDLNTQLTTDGYDFISSTSISNDGDGIDSNPDDPGDQSTPGSSSFHGTHVAGTIAAESNNNQGIAGVAWNARIMPVRVLGVGGGTSYDVIQGVRYAAGLSNDSGTVPSTAAHIINLSLGGAGYSQAAQDTYNDARSQGVIVIAAAGNNNTSTLSYPASYDGVVSVSAVDSNKDRSYYSNYGTKIDVAAPGGDTTVDLNNDGYVDGILSTLADDSSGTRQPNYVFYQGTSMASPHMAGVVALMKAVNINLTPADLDGLLQSGNITEDLGTAGRDDIFGHGLIDALKAVQEAGIPNQSQLVVNPTSLNFESTQTALSMDAYDIANPASVTVSVASSASWISSINIPGPLNGLGTYTVNVDRSGLAEGIYSTNITFTSNVNNVSVPVTMQVGNVTSGGGHAGYHWVILIDPVTNRSTNTITAEYSNGAYSYNFTGIPAGDYRLLAGTDSDNDFLLCDKGEACGGYPLLEQLGIISVTNADLGNINFATGFNFSLGTSSVNSTTSQDGFSKRTGKSIAK